MLVEMQEKGSQLMDKASNAAQSAKESAQNVIKSHLLLYSLMDCNKLLMLVIFCFSMIYIGWTADSG